MNARSLNKGLPKQGLALFIWVGLSACTMGPDYVRPELSAPLQFKEFDGWKQAQPRDHEIPDKWWELFEDPELSALEEQVDLGNQSLAQAEAQFRQAQALVQTARAAWFPTASGSAQTNRFRAASGQNVAVSGVRNLFGFALSAAWEPDLWGGVRRKVESAEATAQASIATLQALRLSTQATLAQNYFQLRILDAQKKLLDETVVTYERTLQITQNRYRVGVAAKSEVAQAETQLHTARAETIAVGIQRAQLEHAVALLIGKSPADLSIAATPLRSQVPAIPVSIPSQLLERRPDVAAAERQVAAANAQIGVAKAAYFPTLSLSASNGFQSGTLSKLLNAGARYWALGPAAAAITLFDGGLLGAQMDQAISAYDASVAAYRQAVLTSFQEVEDNLVALRMLEQQMQAQTQALESARKSVRLTLNQYKAGIVSYLNVMTAQGVALSNENLAVDLLGQRLNAAILLVKAVGGGWKMSDLPTPDEAGGQTKWSQFLPIPVD